MTDIQPITDDNGDDPAAHQPQYRKLAESRLTADEMDEHRKQNIAYEYLCHLEEAKVWIVACITEELPPTTEIEKGLQNGVYLAKLGNFFAAEVVPVKKIYDKDQARYTARGLHFRHTDNVMHWLRAMEHIGLPKIFYPETTDVYDRKNMPRVIYCIHALSLYLFKLGLAPQIQDLYGKVEFTEEEISAMRKELEKYGIQMPAFSKIGGILANEMTIDDAALHAAVIAINDAIEKQVPMETMAALQISAAMLNNLTPEYSVFYQNILYDAKSAKAEVTRNKSIDPDYEPDVYDELLTQAEIQGNVNKINTTQALDKLNAALDDKNELAVLQAIKSSHLSLKNVTNDNATWYMNQLLMLRNTKRAKSEDQDVVLDKEDVQQGLELANQEADAEFQKQVMMKGVNEAIEEQDEEALLKCLSNSSSQLPTVYTNAAPLYLVEYTNMRNEKQGDLDYSEVHTAATILSAIALVNEAIDTGDDTGTFKALSLPDTHVENLDEDNTTRYHTQLTKYKQAKHRFKCPLLTHSEISSAVDEVNQKVQEEQERIAAIGTINDAIDSGDHGQTLTALQLPAAQLTAVNDQESVLYQTILAKDKLTKAESHQGDSVALWLDEIQASVDRANRNKDDGLKLSLCVQAINAAIDQTDGDALHTALTSPDVYLHSVTPECTALYLDKFAQIKLDKQGAGEIGSGWMMNRTKDGHKFYSNISTGEYSWDRKATITKDFSLLTRDEIQTVVSEVTAAYDRELLFKSNEPIITKIQATWRGYQARRKFHERLDFMKTQLPAIIKIQSWIRGIKQRRSYNSRLQYLHRCVDPVVKIQSVVRMWLNKKAFDKRLKFFQDNVDSIIKMQAFVRSSLAKHDYKALMHETDPPLSVVRKFVHLLDANDVDYSEELELQKLRQHVVTEIRSNQTFEHDVNLMDIKIGLLIKNRITLQDVVSHNRKLAKQIDKSGSVPKGLKALSHESREKLEAYQHLFYQLQTNPAYLAKLIFEIPQVKTTKFMESVVFSLFNYGSNPREEYLLMKLFTAALKEEISSKVDKMTDIVTGNPLVVKMIVGYNRNQRGQNALCDILNPLIQEVLGDKELKINTNPVEVYKDWVNQTESKTGVASGLPYDVTTEQALQHPEVRDIINKCVENLKTYTDKFIAVIMASVNKIPYSMRYMSRVMRETLWKKFPCSPEKDILKIVGNLLYYRYINSAIVAPDAFGIIEVSVQKMMSSDERRNLGSIAKILQFAASNKGFGGDSSHLASLNTYIRESHDKFKVFFRTCCEVQEPEVQYNVDQYTDVTMVTKPSIYMSIQEICDTHQLLLDHQDIISPDHTDPLHELLDDLGDATPSVLALVGTDHMGTEDLDETVKTQLGKTEISLTLTNKFEVPESDSSDLKAVLIKTKRMVVEIVACQPGDNLSQILTTPATDDQESFHQVLIQKRDRVVQKRADASTTDDEKLVRKPILLQETRLALEDMKDMVKENLERLEKGEMVSKKDDYQAITNLIVQDIRNQRRYRNNRKQELIKLKATYKSLLNKRTFYEEQIDYYNQYVRKCVDNLQKRANRKSRGFGFFKKDGDKQKESVKYSAQRLYEKGIVLEIEELSQNRFKDCMFEIVATEDRGIFEVNAKFLGVATHKVEIVFQDLLQLQYQGVAVMKMFDSAKINVNLLIFLINKKFYGK